MCFSAQVWADYRRYVRQFGAGIDIQEFVRLYGQRQAGAKLKLPKGMDAAFATPQTDAEREVRAMIDVFNAAEASKLEQELFKQTKRLNDAERTLKSRTTKKALDDQRIATDKIEKAKLKLSDLRRTDVLPRDNRIFPMVYAPVMVWEGGRRVVKPMRYLLRPPGAPPAFDTDPNRNGTYNARRDNLERFWKRQFGYTHGLMVVDTFYENVEGEDGRNKVLQFIPQDGEPMLIACLWARWTGQGEPELLSFAAITDEPPAEVAAAGHDRCIINIKPEHVDAWLNPEPGNSVALQAIFDDKARPYYEHRLAA
jgi:putative SOS response-associated peptidase YedK